MATLTKTRAELAEEVRHFVLRGFKPHYGQFASKLESHALWRRLRGLGSGLWLDTGSLAEAEKLWTREFSALTTNNTLLNAEVQTGRYDELIAEAGKLLAPYRELSDRDRRLELAFILNAWHGLRLVERFDAYVSVEEHTDLAHDIDGAVSCARRYHAICPERFIVKIPLTPAGLLATRRLAEEGIAVNHTLGFSARQNYVVTRIGKPDYVNVFLGRLNVFVAENRLGDGLWVGERATLASQAAIRRLRELYDLPTRQIGASFRSGRQVRDLAGLDVMTIPPKVAHEFLEAAVPPEDLENRTGEEYVPVLAPGVDPKALRLDTLWDVGEPLVECVDALEGQNLEEFTEEDLLAFFRDRNCGDVMVHWTREEIAASSAEGKIPRIEHWRDALAKGRIGLDSLMNLAGLNSFAQDQKAMDDRVRAVLEKAV
jgi:transaldolase